MSNFRTVRAIRNRRMTSLSLKKTSPSPKNLTKKMLSLRSFPKMKTMTSLTTRKNSKKMKTKRMMKMMSLKMSCHQGRSYPLFRLRLKDSVL